MTALPQPGKLLTIADYAALPEDEQRRWELLEGNLLMSPSPTPGHMIAVAQLYSLVASRCRQGCASVPDVDLDLELRRRTSPAPHAGPIWSWSARPSCVRVETEGGLLRAGAADARGGRSSRPARGAPTR